LSAWLYDSGKAKKVKSDLNPPALPFWLIGQARNDQQFVRAGRTNKRDDAVVADCVDDFLPVSRKPGRRFANIVLS
jgi:hypothetical protein